MTTKMHKFINQVHGSSSTINSQPTLLEKIIESIISPGIDMKVNIIKAYGGKNVTLQSCGPANLISS